MAEITAREHSLNYSKNLLTMTGVSEVQSFSDSEVAASLGEKSVTVTGAGLNVSELDTASGVLKITGEVACIDYGKARGKQGFIKKLFK